MKQQDKVVYFINILIHVYEQDSVARAQGIRVEWQKDKTGKISKEHNTNSFICHSKKLTSLAQTLDSTE